VEVPDQGAAVLLAQKNDEADRGEPGVELLEGGEMLLVVDLEAVEGAEVVAGLEGRTPVVDEAGRGASAS
jgi:hypothetical protein